MSRLIFLVVFAACSCAVVGCGKPSSTPDPVKSPDQMKKEMDDMNMNAAKNAKK